MATLRDKVIKLAFENPKLRPHLLPILAAKKKKDAWDLFVEAVGDKTFLNPETGNHVKLFSLPQKEIKPIFDKWKLANPPEEQKEEPKKEAPKKKAPKKEAPKKEAPKKNEDDPIDDEDQVQQTKLKGVIKEKQDHLAKKIKEGPVKDRADDAGKLKDFVGRYFDNSDTDKDYPLLTSWSKKEHEGGDPDKYIQAMKKELNDIERVFQDNTDQTRGAVPTEYKSALTSIRKGLSDWEWEKNHSKSNVGKAEKELKSWMDS